MKFLLVGDGMWRDRFQQLAAKLGLRQHFIFTGLVQPQEIPRLVGLMDTVIHLSLREGLPRSLPQALAAARPVVAYDCDGAREVCVDDETGFLVPPRDLKLLTTRLLQLAGDPELRARLGGQGQTLVKEQFGVQRMVDELHALYLRLAGKHGVSDRAV
jgi:glycosyltransferase involved in cell wall biosynthesis